MPLTIRGTFRRSVHLVRDWGHEGGADGYVVTAKGRQLLGRMAEALATPGAPRAWSLTGPYGGGKSAFALFTAHLLRGSPAARQRLAEADPALAAALAAAVPRPFLPVLVVGTREPLAAALARGLADALRRAAAEAPDADRARVLDLAAAAEACGEGGERAVLDLVDRAAAEAEGGLLVVLDELGKTLEYAARHDGADLGLLQSLAERTARPGAPPVAVVTALHQAFDRSASGASQAQRDEWRKVQGRYEDVAFVEPVTETLRLLAHAVDLPEAERPPGAAATVDAVLAAARLRGGADEGAVREALLGALPVGPAVALVVGPLFRRLAQNERSLFAFLASGEPHSLLDVLGPARDGVAPDLFGASPLPSLYRLDHLYDYLTGAVGLLSERTGRLWAETETALSTLARAGDADALGERLLKQVAVLAFAGAPAGLAPTQAVLRATAGAPPAAVDAALKRLVASRAAVHRRARNEYRVWEGSDVDLDALVREELAAAGPDAPLAELLAEAVLPAPLVARRHAYRTGTTRVFTVHYADARRWREGLDALPDGADGRVVYVLPETDAARPALLDAVREATAAASETDAGRLTLVAVPGAADGLRDAAREMAALGRVRQRAELEGDAAARREVDARRATLGAHLRQRLGALLDAPACAWWRAGAPVAVGGARGLQEALSETADAAFPHAPAVWNELLNRRTPSSSAVRGLKLLLRALLDHPDHPRLGIEGHGAEAGLLASVLHTTGLHRETDGAWGVGRPVEPGSAAVWDAIEGALRAGGGTPVPVGTLFETLRRPPYGVRDGLLPVFLTAVLVRHADALAIYEEGTFVPALDFEAVERLVRGPERFALQFVERTPGRQAVLDELAPLVGAEPAPLPVVLKILGRASALPPYVGRTAALSDRAVAVREALFGAREPATLLFHDLPLACEGPSFLHGTPGADDARCYADRLGDALAELASAYDGLLSDVDRQLAAAFGLRGPTPEARRTALAERARAVGRTAVEARLRPFAVRAADTVLDTRAWTESVAALLAGRPPAQWTDADRRAFGVGLGDLARLFAHREAVDLGTDAAADAARPERVRLGVTSTRGADLEAVVSVHDEDRAAVAAVAARLDAALDGGGEAAETHLAALAAVARARLAARAGTPDLAVPSPPDP